MAKSNDRQEVSYVPRPWTKAVQVPILPNISEQIAETDRRTEALLYALYEFPAPDERPQGVQWDIYQFLEGGIGEEELDHVLDKFFQDNNFDNSVSPEVIARDFKNAMDDKDGNGFNVSRNAVADCGSALEISDEDRITMCVSLGGTKTLRIVATKASGESIPTISHHEKSFTSKSIFETADEFWNSIFSADFIEEGKQLNKNGIFPKLVLVAALHMKNGRFALFAPGRIGCKELGKEDSPLILDSLQEFLDKQGVKFRSIKVMGDVEASYQAMDLGQENKHSEAETAKGVIINGTGFNLGGVVDGVLINTEAGQYRGVVPSNFDKSFCEGHNIPANFGSMVAGRGIWGAFQEIMEILAPEKYFSHYLWLQAAKIDDPDLSLEILFGTNFLGGHEFEPDDFEGVDIKGARDGMLVYKVAKKCTERAADYLANMLIGMSEGLGKKLYLYAEGGVLRRYYDFVREINQRCEGKVKIVVHDSAMRCKYPDGQYAEISPSEAGAIIAGLSGAVTGN